MDQVAKAAFFRTQHSGTRPLILPNVWDVMSAKLVAAAGFTSIATASIAVAANRNYHDGEHIPFRELLKEVKDITRAVDLPLSVDIESGYAGSLPKLKENIRRLIDVGIAGVNIEDGRPGKAGLRTVSEQCRRIEAIRETGLQQHLDLVINARTDVFLQNKGTDTLTEVIDRANAYQQAGADCFYPIGINRYDRIALLVQDISLPVNILLIRPVGDLETLRTLGVKRISLGPGLFKWMLKGLSTVLGDLGREDASSLFAGDPLPAAFITDLVNSDYTPTLPAI